nr:MULTISPECIES: DUF1010 domain-containing protein [unclassified Acidovorax]
MRQLQAFLASSVFAASATSYHFRDAAPLLLRSAFSWTAPVLKSGRHLSALGPNCSPQQTASRRLNSVR